MRDVLQDLRLSVRRLGRQPVFSLTAVLTLAIGLGANAVAFTVVNGLFFKRPPADLAADSGSLRTTPGGDEEGNASLAEYRRFEEATRGSLELAAEGRLTMAWRHDGTTEAAWALIVSSDYFSIVGAHPIVGRVAVGHTSSGTVSAVIGERFWRRSLGAPSLSGLMLRLNDTNVSVAGVLPESFRGPAGLYSPDVWLPLDALDVLHTSAALRQRDNRWLFLFGRLQPGASVPQVQGEIATAAQAMARDWPRTHARRGATFALFSRRATELQRLSTAAAVAMAIIGLVLLLACFNVANLLLARAVERERDLAIRSAIGASRGRLVRLVSLDGLVIAALASVAAIVLAWWTQPLVGSFAIPIEEPQHIDLRPDARVIGFVLVLALLAGVLPGLWSALSAARVNVWRVLGSQGGGSTGARRSSARRWLIWIQVAGSTAFLVVAGLLVQSYASLSAIDAGFAADRLVVAEFEPAAQGYDVDRTRRYTDALLTRARALPGVTSVALSDRAPYFVGFNRLTAISTQTAPCDTGHCPEYPTLSVGPGYFRTLGIPLTAGRGFRPHETGAVVLDDGLAERLWPGLPAVGRSVRLGSEAAPATVVGVTAPSHVRGIGREPPTMYVPLSAEALAGPLTLVARAATKPEALVRPLVRSAEEVDPNIAMTSVKTMRDRMAVQIWPFRTLRGLFSICGMLALVLATAGLASVTTYAVMRRLREFGVRASLGATPADLAFEVLAWSARLLVPGIAAGILVAALVAHLGQAALVGVDALDPLAYVVVAALECAVVFAACLGPALRAARADPLVALRSE
ncbi:MAG TPA: ABC transporter permease [Vicinamibacterales bacterium]|nr:ABC transporter permease [Vicinamibacterales bacterium]